MKVRFKKLHKNAVKPTRAKLGDAGYDLTAVSITTTHDFVSYGMGIAIEVPEGHVGLMFPRSSCSNQDLIMANCVGVVDSNYRGELSARFKQIQNFSSHDEHYNKYNIGERVAQLIIIPIPDIEWEEAEELTETNRGDQGYGSSGK